MKKIFLLILLAGSVFSVKAQTQPDRPNILWIVSEDNIPMIGAYGDQFATTPNLDSFAAKSMLYTNAFSTAPVCAPSRNTLITGMYPPSLGTEHMRSVYPVPSYVKFFPRYLREAGYYTTNNVKKDYNTTDQLETWDESSDKATYKNRKEGQPFFAVFNLMTTHESSLFEPLPKLKHNPESVPLPPYHPNTPEMKHDWAQYYDKVETMDGQFGKLLNELKEAGLAENTIVFYYSDNGGVLARSKRFMYESGLHVPLIIHLPKKYEKLASLAQGTKTDRLVTFLDFAPTILSLAGIKIPEYMQGEAFLGTQQKPEHVYAYGFRGRMDERIDMSRSVRDKKFRYIRNYLPHKIYGQYLEYLWRAPSVKSWEDAYKSGKLDAVQSKFWQEKPAEELFVIESDPHNVKNLAEDPAYAGELLRLRKANEDWLIKTEDAGFIPEAILSDIAAETPLRDYVKSGKYNLKKILETADKASSRNPSHTDFLIQRLSDQDPSVRYWAATGLIVLKAESARKVLTEAAKDPQAAVRIAAAEALYYTGEKSLSITTLTAALKGNNTAARVQALNALSNIGPDAAPALENARALIKETPGMFDYDARAAKDFVGKMGP
jgi:N-sulfoglucosamine sulfohydrolase